ncbi:MAG: crossover junction endodeoxyribonuclease RuvC [Candidatus Staskawiczbacteria bacterium]|nr:crossover junction endodeoxyribonuclease RuvC [Candidatus Staskawiczbacteria bacterium]
MIILGIDPGTATTGYGVIKKQRDRNQKFKVLDFGCITTLQTSIAGERLKKIYKEILKLIDKHKPDIIAVESLFFFKNLKTVMPVSQAKGVILLAAAQKKIPACEFTPLQVKMTVVGYGRAEKKQVQKMTREILDLSMFDFKKNDRKKDDAADALGIAICAALKDLSY